MYKKRKRFRLEEGLNFLKHRNFPPCLFSGLVIFASTRHNPHPRIQPQTQQTAASAFSAWKSEVGNFCAGAPLIFCLQLKRATSRWCSQLSLVLSLALLRGERKKDPGGVLNRVAPRRPAGRLYMKVILDYGVVSRRAKSSRQPARPPACPRFYSPLYNAFQFYWATDSNLIATLMRAAAANNAFSFYYHAFRFRSLISFTGFVCAVSHFAPGP
jgi:hypothetical protein